MKYAMHRKNEELPDKSHPQMLPATTLSGSQICTEDLDHLINLLPEVIDCLNRKVPHGFIDRLNAINSDLQDAIRAAETFEETE